MSGSVGYFREQAEPEDAAEIVGPITSPLLKNLTASRLPFATAISYSVCPSESTKSCCKFCSCSLPSRTRARRSRKLTGSFFSAWNAGCSSSAGLITDCIESLLASTSRVSAEFSTSSSGGLFASRSFRLAFATFRSRFVRASRPRTSVMSESNLNITSYGTVGIGTSGVPLITPVEGSNERPAGKAGKAVKRRAEKLRGRFSMCGSKYTCAPTEVLRDPLGGYCNRGFGAGDGGGVCSGAFFGTLSGVTAVEDCTIEAEPLPLLLFLSGAVFCTASDGASRSLKENCEAAEEDG
mmetsp:Transcript_88413/g.161932  ORF Transcript_88413/g.161932 Transcript_88413/m.161932 type:complete len:295 (+) Transcript_88413:1799-2683(+)